MKRVNQDAAAAQRAVTAAARQLTLQAQRQSQKTRSANQRQNQLVAARNRAPMQVDVTSRGSFGVESAPVAVSQATGPARPRISSARSRGGDLRVRVQHREYVSDVKGTSSTGFSQVLSQSINPGLANLFPWLSTIANNFESYRFNRLTFQYRTEAATSSSGKFLMCVDYDASDSSPSNKQTLLQERTKADCAVWQMIDMICDPADLLKLPQRYVRNGAVANTDIKTYDVGLLTLATFLVNSTVGELYVEYDVELITPTPAPAPLSLKGVAGGTISTSGTQGPLGTAPVFTGSLVPLTGSVGNTLGFPQVGQYLVELQKTGTTLIQTVTSASTATVVVAAAFLTNSAATSSTESWTVNVTSPGQFLAMSVTGDASLSAATVRVADYAVANA